MTIKGKHMRLQPFGRRADGLAVTCTVIRRGRGVHLAYDLQGDLTDLLIPPPADAAARRQRLWESTCLECFIADEASEAYWEFNCSPAGHWNVYRFDAYRRGMCEEEAFSELPLASIRQAHKVRVSCTIDLRTVGLDRRPLKMGLAAVIRSNAGQNSYWALVHPGSHPDFHHPDAFALQVPLSRPGGNSEAFGRHPE